MGVCSYIETKFTTKVRHRDKPLYCRKTKRQTVQLSLDSATFVRQCDTAVEAYGTTLDIHRDRQCGTNRQGDSRQTKRDRQCDSRQRQIDRQIDSRQIDRQTYRQTARLSSDS